jgi:hypothetical protein
MSMAKANKLQPWIWILLLVLWLAPTARVSAGVTVHLAPTGDDTPEVLLSTRIITDDDEPIGSAWQTPGGSTGHITLNENGHLAGDGEPSLLLLPENGLAIAVWSRLGPVGYDVVLSRFEGGAWSTPEPLADSSADELDPFLVADPLDGSVHLVYWVHDTAPRVMHRQAPADLSGWSPAVAVSMPGEIAVRPAATFFDGMLHVVYERHVLGFGSTPRQIVLAVGNGVSFTTETVADSLEASPNWAEVHARRGRLWIDWIDAENAMGWTIRGPGGWEPSQLEAFSGTEDRAFRVRGRIELQVLD